MNWTPLQNWLSLAPLPAVALMLFVAMCVAVALGILSRYLREKIRHRPADSEGQEGYIVSAVLGLLALLMGFTFSLAVDRFEARRRLVLEQANAIGTAYLRAQVLDEPHRTRMSGLLVRYLDNRIALAKAKPGQGRPPELAVNDALVTDIWAGSVAAFDSIKGLDFSSTYMDSMNALIDLDAARKAARTARVPPEVFVVLIVYLITTAAVLGHVLTGLRGRLAAGFLLVLLTLSLVLIIDIDRPTLGGIVESQGPMEELRKSLAATPADRYQKWRTESERPVHGADLGP